jgi:hypothetical protein
MFWFREIVTATLLQARDSSRNERHNLTARQLFRGDRFAAMFKLPTAA